MTYLPHTVDERKIMLDALGAARLQDLFADVPEALRFPDLGMPSARSELEVERDLKRRAGANASAASHDSFLGAGIYHHYRPSTVDYVLSRGELFTAYTPYQPEASQGMLQAMFEFQSMICALTGMEVSNASHYDGATSLAEGVMLALDVGKGRRRILVSPAIHPQYRAVVRTYLAGAGAYVAGDENHGATVDELLDRLDQDTSALVLQAPDFFGQIVDLEGVAARVHAAGALLVVVSDPVFLGLFEPPGTHGADVVVAEGQALGLPPSYGGPHLGIFATRRRYIRRLVGRLVGETVDRLGERGYVLTLGTREQHIRRERATSNICTNSALCALGAAVYLATLGKQGLRRVAELCYCKSHYAAQELGGIPGCAVNPHAPARDFFKEFVLRLPAPAREVNRTLFDQHGIIGGHDLGEDYPDMSDRMLVAVTETASRESIDRLAAALRAVLAGRSGA